MMLLSPLIMLMVFGTLIATRDKPPEGMLRTLIAAGAAAMVLLSVTQLVTNQFGFDRAGFRTYVLCGAPRRDILLGKNLSFVPLALGLGSVMLILVQIFLPTRFDHFLAGWPRMVSMFLIFCLVANVQSIIAPIQIAAGAMRPTNMKASIVLMHFGFLFLLPVMLSPTLLPLGVEYFAAEEWGTHGPFDLLLGVIEMGIVILVYWLVISWEGRLLQRREKKILETVTARAE
jgi:hypothetical protein